MNSFAPKPRLGVERLEDRLAPAIFTVVNTNDSGAGSLRQAILDANNEVAHPGADTIVFAGAAGGGTFNLSTFTNLATSTATVPQPAGPSALLVTSPIAIAGTGEKLTRTGATAFRLFQVTAAGSLTLQSLTLSNGMAQGAAGLSGGGAGGLGGAIYNQGTLKILGCALTGNQAIGGGNADVGSKGGGGLGGPGDASNNGGGPNGGASGGTNAGGVGGFGGGGGTGSIGGVGGFGGGGGSSSGPTGGAGGFGGGGGAGNNNGGQGGFGGGFGGAAFGGAGTFLGGGGGGMGGAVFNQGGTITIANSTIAGNTARGADTIGTGAWGGSAFGGGVFSLNGSLTLTNATIAGNTVSGGHGFQDGAASGGAVYVVGLNVGAITPTQNVVITLDNSILANSTGGPDLVFGIGDAIPLIHSNGPIILKTGVPPTPAILPGDIRVIDPKLGALQNNGGLTPTMALQAGSPAIDAGSNTAANGLGTDPRGPEFARLSNGRVDIGAFEVQVPAKLSVGGATDGTAQVFAASTTTGKFGTALASPQPFGAVPTDVRTATADVNGDAIRDTILVTGPGTPIRVAVVSGADNTTLLVSPFDPFGGDFPGGGYVAAADLDGDGRAEFVVTPDQGGGPRVSIFALAPGGSLQTKANFFGIDDPAFRGGARIALGDVNNDGRTDALVAAGFGGGPRVALFDGATLFTTRTKLKNDFFAFPEDATTLRNGIFAALGDINGDGFADLIFGGGPGGAPRVFILSGQKLVNGDPTLFSQPVANFFVAGNANDRGGVRVAAKYADGDAKADLAVGSGEGSPANVRIYLGKNFTGGGEPGTFQDISVFGGATLVDGVYVG